MFATDTQSCSVLAAGAAKQGIEATAQLELCAHDQLAQRIHFSFLTIAKTPVLAFCAARIAAG
jgi:hypothetical protein